MASAKFMCAQAGVPEWTRPYKGHVRVVRPPPVWRREFPAESTPAPRPPTCGDLIDRMYARLGELVVRRVPGVADDALEAEIRRVLQRLREAQAEEARAMRARFADGLSMPIGAGGELLDRIEAFLGGTEGEDPSH